MMKLVEGQVGPYSPPGPAAAHLQAHRWTREAQVNALAALPFHEYGVASLITGAGADPIDGISITVQLVPRGSATRGHQHSWWHLYLVTAGAVHLQTVDARQSVESAKLSDGDIVAIPPWIGHRFLADEATDCHLLNISNRPRETTRGTGQTNPVSFTGIAGARAREGGE